MTSLKLPEADGTATTYTLVGEPVHVVDRKPARSRIALAAAHVVVNPFADAQPGESCAIDWDATLAFRRHLARLGLGIAEAMDTAQRGMALGFDDALELIRRTTGDIGKDSDIPVFSGCNTDHLASPEAELDQVQGAYLHQVEKVQECGGRVIVMASRHLARTAKGPDCYAKVYADVLAACEKPVILHWLGKMFDPALAGYWGSDNAQQAMELCLGIINENAAKVDGIKVSMLDLDLEVAMRARLPDGVRLYTGDDFNFPELIVGDGERYSDALLGIFDPIAPVASAALAALDSGDSAACRRMLDSTVGLSRHIFQSPTYHYKTGVVFLAWLNGYQDHFTMLGGAQSMRSLPHLVRLFKMADGCGLLADPDLATGRMATFLEMNGFSQGNNRQSPSGGRKKDG